MILIVSHANDDHAVGVLEALARIGRPAALFDTGRFPNEAFLTQRFENHLRDFELTIGNSAIDVNSCRVGWWRRPRPLMVHPGMSPEAAAFTYSECYEAIAGLWPALNLKWVNPPHLDELAHHKPYQLAVATEVGLTIPRTAITNDPQAARKFISELTPGPCIYKTFLATERWWRETRLVRADEMQMLESVRHAPVIFQEYIVAEADVRVTIMGQKMFPAAITCAPGGYDVDYRMDMDGANFVPTTLSSETERGIRALMDRLGLVYGAVDLRRTSRGDVFLEINPAGEWRFVEERTKQPITAAMAELLADLDGA